jgi:CRISPR-associated protein Csy1
MNDPIKEFLAERKSRWLQGKINATMPGEEKARFEQEAEKKFSLDEWLPDAARRVAQLSMVSHPSKFSHPSAKTSSIIADATKRADGFLRTGNSEVNLDVLGNAAALDVYKFLSLELDDGRTLIEHLEQGSETAKQRLAITTATFEEIQKGLLTIKQGDDTAVTSGKVKQVYFPCDGDYHLLSILTPSGLMFELRNRIRDMLFSEQVKEARELKKSNGFSNNGFDELFNLTMVSYGGAKPQNISVLNYQHGGKAYLLPCLPPLLQKGSVRLPRYNFFTNTLWVGRYKDSFNALQNLMRSDYRNRNIREGRDSIILFIIDQVIDVMWSVRNHEAGWSQTEYYLHLPAHQKLWLDDVWAKERGHSGEWLSKVVEEFSRWIVLAYNKLQDKQGTPWGDDELLYVKKMIEQSREALR